MYSRLLLLPLFVVLAFPLTAFGAYDCSIPTACRVTCDGTNDHIDINAAISTATSGGTVFIGAGSCAIGATVTLSKPLTLAGAGASATTLAGAASPMLTVAHGATGLVRVTGLAFTSDVYNQLRLSGPITQVRVDGNRFVGSDNSIFVTNGVEGVIDHNEFINCDRCVMTTGASDAAWALDFGTGTGNFIAGSSHMLFIETNRFERNASYVKAGSEIHYAQQGARTVFRYNTVDMRQWTSLTWVHDSHGNQCYYDETADFRGQPIHEVYENAYLLNRVGNVFGLRSGSNLIFNNTLTISNPAALDRVIKLVEEEAWSGTGQHFTGPGFDYVWPTEDMVTNTFIWGNTINGVPLTSSNVNGAASADCCGTYPDTSHVINFNRDVWMHAPQSTGGRTYYDGRPGASGRDTDGTLVFTTSGANAYYPYTPYTYPHPLATVATAPKPPTGVRIVP